ncbi:MAG: DEAD/DEAH box helicase [Bacillota bacterium]|nr:DEAD/DEAH box helicase [Bacillota bacterium]
MIQEDKLLQIFNEETSGKMHSEGQRVLLNDLVASAELNDVEGIINIEGIVISENLFNEYNTKIIFEVTHKSILSTYCSCEDYEKNGFKKKNYCCKHLVATFYKAAGALADHPLIKEVEIEQKDIHIKNVLSMLLGDEDGKDEVKIEVYINKSEWNNNLSAEFKIGLSSTSAANLYILKDIKQFLISLHNSIPVNYGKSFTFNMNEQQLSSKDRHLIDFIETIVSIDESNKYISRNAVSGIEGKYINIPDYLTREFFQVVQKHRVYLNEGFFSRPVETEILSVNPPVDFDLKLIAEEYVLKSPGGMPASLSSKNNTFLYGSSIYLPDFDFCHRITPYLQIFNQAKVVVFPASEEDTVLRRLIPALNFLSLNVTMSRAIKEKIVLSDCSFSFYFNMENREITLILKVKYGSYEFNIFEECTEKVIYRNEKKEGAVKAILRSYGFEPIKKKFHLLKDDNYIYRFFKSEVGKLQEIGEIYYSENFKGLKTIGTNGIQGEIKAGKYDYFELDFKIGDIPAGETAEILRAFRENLKYYRLKDGHFLDLEELELNKFLKLVDSLDAGSLKDNNLRIHKNKGVYLSDYLEKSGIRYIKGNDELDEIKNRLNSLESLTFVEPGIFKGTLREYQKTGYKWFKTLDHLGFGGILGDEMGLGKTIQTIAFIASKKGEKTLIVAPTSLVFNWTTEFDKFAPDIRTAAVNGFKEEREEILQNFEDYDVLITTYNLLRRDLEYYSEVEFDYCILDEAQNIKNPNSQNSQSAKAIRARRKFALSGTPIENSLMELWSIFDFIMPGYLYDEKRFSVRYDKRLREEPVVIEELNRLIRPFILRRKKKDVIKELPDKIEKTLMVDLGEEQKKVYKAYANHAMELIQKKVKEEEFKNSKIEILSYLTKLRLLCLDPSVAMDGYDGSSSKLEALIEILKDSIEEGHRILVFSQFTSVLKNIIKRVGAEGISFSYLDGSISSDKRMKMVKEFNDGENSVFLISLKAGGTGLNLTSADVVIHFDPWWNPAVEEQAADRAHRIGQKNVVEVIKIIAKGTIEEKILALQKDKKRLITELIGDGLHDWEGSGILSEEEVIELFEEKVSWI